MSRSRAHSAVSAVWVSGLCTMALPAIRPDAASGTGERERVVPRGDEADDALGLAELDRPRGQGDGAGRAAAAEQSGGMARVVEGAEGRVADFFESVLAGFPGLPLEDVQDFGLPVEQQVGEAEEGAMRWRGERCAHSRWAARARRNALVTSLAEDSGQGGEGFPGEGCRGDDGTAGTADHVAGQPLD